MSRPTQTVPLDNMPPSTRADDLKIYKDFSTFTATQEHSYVFSEGLCYLQIWGRSELEGIPLDREDAAALRDWLSDVLKYPDPEKTSPVRVVAFTARREGP